jgi:hypothetical protein
MTYCPLSNYSDIFGLPNQGPHSIRLFDIAIIDYIFTIMAALLTTHFAKIPVLITTIGYCAFAIVMHMLFGVNTNEMQWLGLTCS